MNFDLQNGVNTLQCYCASSNGVIVWIPIWLFPGCCNQNTWHSNCSCFFIGCSDSVQRMGSQNRLALCLEYSKMNSDLICSRCFPLAILFFSCLISGPLSHLAGLIIRVIIPVSVTLSSSLDPSSVQKVQRPCQHLWTLVSIWETQNRYKRVLWMWVWLPEFLCTHFTAIMEISIKMTYSVELYLLL